VLASALQEEGRALVIGEKTAGEALPAISTELPTGAVFVYPIANLKTGKGKMIEGEGITPDLAVNLDRKSLLEGRDLQMEAALKAIKENIPVPALSSSPVLLPPRDVFTIRNAGLPPPPALSTGQGSGRGTGIGSGSGSAGPPPPMAAPPPAPAVPAVPAKDQRSLEVISEFLSTIGGEAALGKIESYSIKGVTVMKTRGMEIDGVLEIYRRKPDLYSELFNTDALGELREIYTKEGLTLQTDFGMTTETRVGPVVSRREVLAPILQLLDKAAFRSLSYSGIFDREGRKTHVIDGIASTGDHIALAFDVETKLLVGYVGNYFSFTLGEYEKVQDLLLPFSIDRGTVTLSAYEIKINPVIDDGNFKKKINCFDRPN
jgi:hypothetical protein